jgi:hypothetical protein
MKMSSDAFNGSVVSVPSPCSILYCHCAFAKVVPADVKTEVLQRLVQSGAPFEAVPDLCALSAAKDPLLRQLAERAGVRIVACYPRAVKGLFAAAGAALPIEGTEILNMRDQSSQEVVDRLLGPIARGGESES